MTPEDLMQHYNAWDHAAKSFRFSLKEMGHSYEPYQVAMSLCERVAEGYHNQFIEMETKIHEKMFGM